MTLQQKTYIVALLAFLPFSIHGQQQSDTRILISDASRLGFPSWSPDGKYLVYQYSDRFDSVGKNGLWKISIDGKEKEQLFNGVAEHPKWSPDNRFIVFDADTGNSIRLLPVDISKPFKVHPDSTAGGEPRKFLPDSVGIFRGGLPCWSPDGSQIAFLEGKTLSCCIFHLETGKVKRIFHEEGMVPMPCCWHPDGNHILLALMERETRRSNILKISSDGMVLEKIPGHHDFFYRHLAISPDGSHIAYSVMIEGSLGLYIMSAKGGPTLPLLVTPGIHYQGISWSPDGRHIAFSRNSYEENAIMIMELDLNAISMKLKEVN